MTHSQMSCVHCTLCRAINTYFSVKYKNENTKTKLLDFRWKEMNHIVIHVIRSYVWIEFNWMEFYNITATWHKIENKILMKSKFQISNFNWNVKSISFKILNHHFCKCNNGNDTCSTTLTLVIHPSISLRRVKLHENLTTWCLIVSTWYQVCVCVWSISLYYSHFQWNLLHFSTFHLHFWVKW